MKLYSFLAWTFILCSTCFAGPATAPATQPAWRVKEGRPAALKAVLDAQEEAKSERLKSLDRQIESIKGRLAAESKRTVRTADERKRRGEAMAVHRREIAELQDERAAVAASSEIAIPEWRSMGMRPGSFGTCEATQFETESGYHRSSLVLVRAIDARSGYVATWSEFISKRPSQQASREGRSEPFILEGVDLSQTPEGDEVPVKALLVVRIEDGVPVAIPFTRDDFEKSE